MCLTSQVEISSGPQNVVPVKWISVVVPRVSYQSDGDQQWFPECLTSHVEISSGPQSVLLVRWRSVIVPRVSYQLSRDQ